MELMNYDTTIEGYIPKLIETPEHFIINTQLYEKDTLKPVPMKFNTNIAVETNMPFIVLKNSLEKTSVFMADYHVATVTNNEYNKDKIIQDKNNPNVFYMLKRNMISNNRSYDTIKLLRIEYNTSLKKYNITHSYHSHDTDVYSYTHKGDMDIIYETDDYLVLRAYSDYNTYYNEFNSGYYYTYIVKIRKTDFAKTIISTNHSNNPLRAKIHYLCGENDILYIYQTDLKDNKYITKINLTTDICTDIWTYTSNCQIPVDCNPIELDGYYYSLCSYTDENNNYLYKLIKMSLDKTTDTISHELLDINLNGYILDSSLNTNIDGGQYMQYTLRKIITNNKTYLSCLIHENANRYTANKGIYSYQCKLVLFSFDTTSVKILDTIPLVDSCWGSLIYNDSKHLILYMSNCVLFYVFDETQEKFVQTYKKGGMFCCIGFDSLNRFITQTNDDTIEILTELNACILKADFAEEIYNKDTLTEIETTVSFYAKNFLDEYLETNVKLSLIGPVMFQENETKELITTTSKEGLKTVPVIITGNGNIEVIITQNT